LIARALRRAPYSCDNAAAMSKNDELDRRRAAAFAWRFSKPGEAIVLPDEDHAEAAPKTGAASRGASAEPAGAGGDGYISAAYDACDEMADEIERVWDLPETEQASALEPLLLRASELGLGLCAMQHYPWQSVRLLRLAVRCRDALPDEAWEAAWTSATWLDYSHPEIVDLLVEVAHARATSLVATLMLVIPDTRWQAIARISGAVTRIARLIDDGPGYVIRGIAVAWISCTGGREAVPALRRALREPHFVLRYRALDVLHRRFPDMLQEDDLLFLLRDAVRHAPPDNLMDEDIRQANFDFPDTLEAAVAHLRPRAALEPLVTIAEDRGVSRWRLRSCLDAAWALGVLAAAFPEQATPLIDKRLAHVQRDRRRMAVEAAGRLPDALARPRLLAAAADAVPEIADRAQALWLQRYSEICPLDPLAGLETSLLAGPPSEQMRSRLGVLRSGPLEARAAMVEVLLGEAPDPEALVLLLFAIVDSRLWELKPRPGLPEYRETFCRVLVERFGVPAVHGLLALEARYQGRWGWLHAIVTALTSDAIPAAAHPALRAVATRYITEADGRPEYDAIAILAHLGPPPELVERLWQLARDPAEPFYVHHIAVRALALVPADDRVLNRAVLAEMEAAFAAPDLPRFALAAAVGFARKLPAAAALAERALAELGPARPDDPRVIAALADCIEGLATAGRLPESFLSDALRRPGTYSCAVAARCSLRRKLQDPEVEALRAALTGDDPACAAEAARTLLGQGILAPENADLPAIAARAPAVLRAELIYQMWGRGAPLRDHWSLLEPLLVSADPDVTEPLRHLSYDLEKSGLRDELRALLPRVVDPELRLDIDDVFARTPDHFWEDEVEEGDA
jgi:hypothetical protein